MHVKAYAKINPYLDIIGRMDNGYHELDIVFYPITLCDELDIELCMTAEKIRLTCNITEFAGPDNILYKAYDELSKYLQENKGKTLPHFSVHLVKNIPSGAGLGGGSSDAAAFLKAANILAGLGLSEDELLSIGTKIGADVPACLIARPCYGGGIGEKLVPIEDVNKEYYIVVKPQVSFNTAKMYSDFDRLDKAVLYQGENAIHSGNNSEKISGDFAYKKGFNVFEQVIPERELIEGIKQGLLDVGASYSMMTGSGSCVFGAFDNSRLRDEAFDIICEKFADMKIYSCELLKNDD